MKSQEPLYEVLILRTADLDKREKVKGAGSLGGTEAVSGSMISMEGVAASEVRGYRFGRQNLKKQKMK